MEEEKLSNLPKRVVEFYHYIKRETGKNKYYDKSNRELGKIFGVTGATISHWLGVLRKTELMATQIVYDENKYFVERRIYFKESVGEEKIDDVIYIPTEEKYKILESKGVKLIWMKC